MSGYMDMSFGAPTSAASSGSGIGGIGAVGAIAGLAGEIGSAWYGNRMAEKRNRESFDQQKWLYSNRYQLQVNDLKAAGLNPMLAYANAAPSVSAPPPAPVHRMDIGAMSQVLMASAQAAKTATETESISMDNLVKKASLMNLYDEIHYRVRELEQRIKTGKATQEEVEARRDLVKMERRLAEQEYNIKGPEEFASAGAAAKGSATVTRLIKPVVDVLRSLGISVGGGSGYPRKVR